jgi:hypothetical protein
MINSSDIIGNRTRNLPVCSAVPEPTVALRIPKKSVMLSNIGLESVDYELS